MSNDEYRQYFAIARYSGLAPIDVLREYIDVWNISHMG